MYLVKKVHDSIRYYRFIWSLPSQNGKLHTDRRYARGMTRKTTFAHAPIQLGQSITNITGTRIPEVEITDYYLFCRILKFILALSI